MEPTNRRETGTRPSAMKRYGPFVAIVVVIAIVVGVMLAGRRATTARSRRQADTGPVKTTGRAGHDQRLQPQLDQLGPELRHEAAR